MARYVEGSDRKQVTLLPECLDDYIAEDNPVRVVEAFVEELDLEALGFARATPAVTGRPAYHPGVASAYRAIHEANLNLALDGALREELAEIDAALAEACAAAQDGLSKRQEWARQAAAGSRPWDSVEGLPADPRPSLAEAAKRLREQASAFEASSDEKARAALVAERDELDARRRLSDVRSAVLDAMAKHELCAKLQKCIDAMGTTGISRKSTELSRTMASRELADALNEELKRLKVHELQAVMKPASPGGRTQFKLALQLPGGGTPGAILSEGEQRAIAIASFLAEVKLGRGRGGVVFDDPVSSLDHRRRCPSSTASGAFPMSLRPEKNSGLIYEGSSNLDIPSGSAAHRDAHCSKQPRSPSALRFRARHPLRCQGTAPCFPA